MKNTFMFIAFILSMSAFGQQQIPNGSFENWSGGDTLNPDGWFSLNVITQDYPTYGTTRTSDAYDGAYALKLVSGKVDATPFGFPMIDTTAIAGLGNLTPQGPQEGIPFTDRPQKLTFYYKYSPGIYPVGIVDTGQVSVKFKLQGSGIGEGIMKFYGNAVTQYTYAEILINWWNQDTPDSLEIGITSSTTGFSHCEVCYFANQIGSELIIDKMEFVYPSGINVPIGVGNLTTIYPNPASDIINLNINKANNADMTLNIYNVIGTLVKSEILEQNQQQINIEDLSNGIYIVEIKNKEWTEKKKLIIQK